MDFFEALAELHDGLTPKELNEAFQSLVAEVKQTGRKGSLTLKIEVKPPKNRNSETILVTDQIVVKAPSMDRGASIFFANVKGEISRDPHNQELIPFKMQKTGTDPEAPAEE